MKLHALGFVLFVHFLVGSAGFKLLHKTKKQENRNRVKDHPKGFGTAKYAVIIGIDGFGGEYLRNVSQRFPAFQSFFDFGAHTTKSRNIAPTISAPNWAGYLTSMSVNQHGVYTNSWTVADGNPRDLVHNLPPISGRGLPQTIFSVIKAHDENLKTALMFTWGWFIQVAKKNPHVDNWFWGHEGIECGKTETGYDCDNRQDWNTQRKVIEAIKTEQPTLTFVHLDAVDEAGHSSYWGSNIYYEMVGQKEFQVAGILEALENTITESGKPMIEETIVAIVADHGGYRNSHDITPPFIAEVYVPLLIRGPGVRNVNLEDPKYADVASLDMPVTILNALGIEKEKYMKGRVLEEIYGDD